MTSGKRPTGASLCLKSLKIDPQLVVLQHGNHNAGGDWIQRVWRKKRQPRDGNERIRNTRKACHSECVEIAATEPGCKKLGRLLWRRRLGHFSTGGSSCGGCYGDGAAGFFFFLSTDVLLPALAVSLLKNILERCQVRTGLVNSTRHA